MRALLLPSLLLVFLNASRAMADPANDEHFFESRIRPVLVEHCFECHASTSEELGGAFLLDSREGLRRGGESGAAIVPGDPDASLLIAAIRYEDLEMPPQQKLPPHVVADLEQWILRGAFDPRDPSARPSARAVSKSSLDDKTAREFWSFRPPQSQAAPAVTQREWPQRKIDTFILAELEARGLGPSPPAPAEVLVRRLSFDLVGLPPSPELLAWYRKQTSRPDAYERLVERLLGSPQFGARWARLWLDVARYAEDQAHIVGNNDSLFYPNAFLYRDWLIGALNDDMPFDRFTKLQLAADLIAPEAMTDQAALGFLGLGPKYYRRNAPEVMADEWEDRVDTVTRGFLGLTVACARCHDHKYDPISTEDYYALAGVFASTEMFNRPLDPQADPAEQAEKAVNAIHVVREGKPQDLPVHIRGNALTPGKLVPRRFLPVLFERPLQQGSGRAQLAEAIACEENPLTARVIVNRIWGQYFGRPLVDTPSNFGKLGSRPSHPRLLDDLAVRFMQAGWSMKWLHREIVMSACYQQTSRAGERIRAADPANELLGRMPRRRLSIEMWRDALLRASGELQEDVGGKSLEISDPQAKRRSVYARVSRLELDAMQQMFDFPDPNVHAARRSQTTTPLQKLFVLNSDFMLERARHFVDRLRRESQGEGGGGELTPQIRRGYALVYGRQPTWEELTLAREYLQTEDHWPRFAQVLLAANELMFVD